MLIQEKTFNNKKMLWENSHLKSSEIFIESSSFGSVVLILSIDKYENAIEPLVEPK